MDSTKHSVFEKLVASNRHWRPDEAHIRTLHSNRACFRQTHILMTSKGQQPVNGITRKLGGWNGRPAKAFSMAELMIAVVILGVGLLITSSMFPIAWYKAREVAEAAKISNSVDTAQFTLSMLANTYQPDADDDVERFFAGVFLPGGVANDSLPKEQDEKLLPDTRIQHLALGNYLADDLWSVEDNPLQSSSPDAVPVSDTTWLLNDTLLLRFPPDPLDVRDWTSWSRPIVRPHARLLPPIDSQPSPWDSSDTDYDPIAVGLWKEQFEAARYCWSAFYRLDDIAQAEMPSAGRRVATIYYVLLHRPGAARYARQEGYDAKSSKWDSKKRLDSPRARPAAHDVALPVPWRIMASLVNSSLPDCPEDPDKPVPEELGLQSEIEVDDEVLAEMLQIDTQLIDDRTGQIFRVVQRREIDYPNVVLTLDGEYTWHDTCDTELKLFPKDPGEVEENWKNRHKWLSDNCSRSQEEYCECGEDAATWTIDPNPQDRVYWVFPPPVESTSDEGVPYFDGTSPVVSIEVKRLAIDPPSQD